MIGLAIAIAVPSRHEQVVPGSVAQVQQTITLDDGRHLPRGLLTQVRQQRASADAMILCLIEDPLGEPHWIARDVLVPASASGGGVGARAGFRCG